MSKRSEHNGADSSMPAKYLRKHEAAELLGISPRTLDTWLRGGLVPYFKIGRTVRLSAEDIAQHLNATHLHAP